MSKLFETLEKIRENEVLPRTGVNAGGRGGNVHRQRQRLLLLAVVTAILVLAVLWIYAGRVFTSLNHHSTLSHTQLNINQKPRGMMASALNNDPGSLNLKGCRLVDSKKYWPAIVLFQKANRLARRPEPLINMAVALSEMGLFGPAMEKFSLAAAISPGNPALIRNLAILKRHGISLDHTPPLPLADREKR